MVISYQSESHNCNKRNKAHTKIPNWSQYRWHFPISKRFVKEKRKIHNILGSRKCPMSQCVSTRDVRWFFTHKSVYAGVRQFNPTPCHFNVPLLVSSTVSLRIHLVNGIEWIWQRIVTQPSFILSSVILVREARITSCTYNMKGRKYNL